MSLLFPLMADGVLEGALKGGARGAVVGAIVGGMVGLVLVGIRFFNRKKTKKDDTSDPDSPA